MSELYKQIINGIQYKVCLDTQKNIDIVMGEEGCGGYFDSGKQLIVIAEDMQEELSVRVYVHEYIHAHRYAGGYNNEVDLNEEALCDYIMANWYSVYHTAEHFRKHIKEGKNEL